jgi:hypothetical protein
LCAFCYSQSNHLYPDFYTERNVTKRSWRKRLIISAFPDCIDVNIICLLTVICICILWINFLQYTSNYLFTALKTWQWPCICGTFSSILDQVASCCDWGFLNGFCWYNEVLKNRPCSPPKLACLQFMIIIQLYLILYNSLHEIPPLTFIALSTR